jgi:hypothetical protein
MICVIMIHVTVLEKYALLKKYAMRLAM